MKRKKIGKEFVSQKSNPFVSGIINLFFDILKHFIRDFESVKKINKMGKYDDKFSDLEHLLIRLEDKQRENRHQIEDLKTRLLWGNIVIIILLLINIFQVVR